MKRVLVFGTFDLLHPGHISFLTQARSKGDWLIASVARDTYVRARKKREPFHGEDERLRRLLDTGLVQEAHLSDADTGSYRIIEKTKPDVICFGHDQHALKAHLDAWLAEHPDATEHPVETYVLEAHRPEVYKSSKIISRNAPDGSDRG